MRKNVTGGELQPVPRIHSETWDRREVRPSNLLTDRRNPDQSAFLGLATRRPVAGMRSMDERFPPVWQAVCGRRSRSVGTTATVQGSRPAATSRNPAEDRK